MKYILLPGLSPKNKDWAYELKSDFKTQDLELIVVEWNHWEGEQRSFSISFEKENVLRMLKGVDDYTIIAKSVGTRLASFMIEEELLNPALVIFMGIPSQNEIYKKALGKLDPSKIKVIQNDRDPLGSFEEVEKFVATINPEIEVLEGERNDHNYPYGELILDLIKN